MFIETGIKINGYDITDFIAYQGVKWSRNDVDGPNAGRTLSGEMVRDRIATKIRLDITCRPLEMSDFSTLLELLEPEFVNVTYYDPMYGLTTKVMYANNHGGNYLIHRSNGKDIWDGISFPLVER